MPRGTSQIHGPGHYSMSTAGQQGDPGKHKHQAHPCPGLWPLAGGQFLDLAAKLLDLLFVHLLSNQAHYIGGETYIDGEAENGI